MKRLIDQIRFNVYFVHTQTNIYKNTNPCYSQLPISFTVFTKGRQELYLNLAAKIDYAA